MKFHKFVLAVLAFTTYSSLAQPTSKSAGHYEAIESKALRADVSNRETIKELAHEVVVYPHTYSLPEPVATILENKLTDAEINFRNKNGHAVEEEKLVELMNWLVEKFQLPPYCRTTPAQVRTVRMKLTLLSPNLMGNTLAGSDVKKGGHVHTAMSPIQAMHLLNTMMDEKVLNPDYQDPSIDIIAAEQARKREHSKAANVNGAFIATQINPKKKEVRDAISSAAAGMTIQDSIDIVNHAFKTLQLD